MWDCWQTWFCRERWTRRQIASPCRMRIFRNGRNRRLWPNWCCRYLTCGPATSQAWPFRSRAKVFERIAVLFVDALSLYVALGVVFAFAFVCVGLKRIDSQAVGTG